MFPYSLLRTSKQAQALVSLSCILLYTVKFLDGLHDQFHTLLGIAWRSKATWARESSAGTDMEVSEMIQAESSQPRPINLKHLFDPHMFLKGQRSSRPESPNSLAQAQRFVVHPLCCSFSLHNEVWV